MLLVVFQQGVGAAGPPFITSQPQSITIILGASGVLSVTANGATSYQWYIGASGDTANPVVGETSSSITVSPSVKTLYWVRVSNVSGDTDSNDATVTVLSASEPGVKKHKPKFIRIKLSELDAAERKTNAEFIKSFLEVPEYQDQETKQLAIRIGKKSQEQIKAEQAILEAIRIEKEDEIRIIRENNEIIALILMMNG